MSNAKLQKRLEQQLPPIEGAGWKVALFCCLLFLLFQVVVFLYPHSSTQVSRLRFTVLPGERIELTAGSGTENLSPANYSGTKASYQFSPFFFEPIAINFCDKDLLMSVKGIGPSLADAIMRTREKNGGFKKAEDLLQVKGIGPSRMQRFSNHFDFSDNGRVN
ncbi:MAG: helix-hairpin-helix domain-containing protein [Thermodesulfobacteriota bacterium]